MHTKIGSYEAKTRLPELLRQVRKGKSFTITNRGEAVAELVPVRQAAEADAARAAEQMIAFMRSHPIRGVDIKALIEEGRD
jgi:prevent-host-death family protein